MGLFDRIVLMRVRRVYKVDMNSKLRKHIKGDKYKNTVIVFLGWNTRRIIIKHILRKFPNKKVVVFEPPNKIVSPDPEVSISAFNDILAESKKIIDKENVTQIYGLSSGAILACIAANNVMLDKLVLGFPTDRIVPVLWSSPRTSHIIKEARKSYSPDHFDKIFSKFDPVNNLAGLNVNKLIIYLAKGDSIIPYKRGLNLVKAMKNAGLNPKTVTIPLFGHYIAGTWCQIFGNFFSDK